jgi:tetratricopeptide (TPR) repeat protein
VRSLYVLMLLACTLFCGMCLPACGQTQTDLHSAADWIERGKAELGRYFFSDAESAFRKAILLEPDSAEAHLLLARALLGNLPPNLMLFPDSEGLLPKAEQAANRAVELAPDSAEALCVAGLVSFRTAKPLKDPQQRGRWIAKAQQSFSRALAADPRSVEAHVELAHIVIEDALGALLGARFASGMKVGQMGPIANVHLRHALRAKYSKPLEEAIAHAQRALETDPKADSAMKQMAGAFLVRADLGDTDSAFGADMKHSQEWQQKEAAVRAGRQPKNTPNHAGGVLGAIIGATSPKVPPPSPKQ